MSLTYSAAVEQTITAGEQIHQIVNGTATTEVTIEDGSKVPSIRKALLDNFYFKDPIAWQVGQTENVFNQLRQFTDGSWWYAPSATASNPISMGSTPVGNPLWKVYSFDAIGKLTPQIREALRRSYAEVGYNLVDGSFEAGGTLTSASDVMMHEVSGKAYSGAGPFPQDIGAGTNPASAGFTGRSSALLVNLAQTRFATISALLASVPTNGAVSTTAGYYSAADGGGATYVYNSTSVATADGFLVHAHPTGGRWLLLDNRERLPVQVAGAKVDGTTDDRTAFLAILASKRKVLLDGVMRISGAAINLATYITSEQLRFDMEGADPIGSQLLFDANGGLFSSTFFRGFSLKNINIKNKAMDKTGSGFSNDPGAEMVNWENVTFTGWRCGFNLHCWNSSTKNVASRGCYYAGAIYGTSQDDSSLYAIGCDYAWALGCKYPGGLSGVMGLPSGGLAFSYATLKALAADECGPYMFGRCFNLKIASMGAERGIGPYLVDLSLYSVPTGRQNVTIECFDGYVQSDDGVTAVFGPITNAYGSLKVENTHIFSDKNIPLFSGDGRGIKTRNVQYNSTSAKRFTDSATNGMVITDELILGSDYAQLRKVGYAQGGFDQIRKVRAMFAMPLSATGKVVIRIQDTSVNGLKQGVMASGKATFYPVRKGGNNANYECGTAIFSVAGDFDGAFSSINLQKLGSLSTMTATSRVTGTVQELALTLPAVAAVQYLCELEFWCNGKFASSNIDYYVES